MLNSEEATTLIIKDDFPEKIVKAWYKVREKETHYIYKALAYDL